MTQPCSTRRSSDLLGATQHRHAISQIMDMLVFLDIVADHHHALYAFGGELSADLRHAEAAVHRLPTGHGYGIVVENLVGDLHICRDGSPDRENAGVEIGTVTQIGENMLGGGEDRKSTSLNFSH